MQNILNFSIMLLLLLLLAGGCEKDDTTLGRQIQGRWNMESCMIDYEEAGIATDVFGMQYSDYDGRRGTTRWHYYDTFFHATDTSLGVYWLTDNDTRLYIHQLRQISIFGGFDTVSYEIILRNDTMWLEGVDPGGYHWLIRSVRVHE